MYELFGVVKSNVSYHLNRMIVQKKFAIKC